MNIHEAKTAGLGMYTVEHVRFLDMVDTRSQRLAHRVALVLLAMLCAFRGRYDHPPFCPCPAGNRVPSSQGSPCLLDRTEEPAPAITSGFHGVDCGGYVFLWGGFLFFWGHWWICGRPFLEKKTPPTYIVESGAGEFKKKGVGKKTTRG